MRLQKSFGVVVLFNESKSLIKGEERDFLAEIEVIACASLVAEALSTKYKVAKVPITTSVEIALEPYLPTDWVIFNLGEGIEGKLFEGARIAWALDAMGYCFTGGGGDNLAWTTNKAFSKSIFNNYNIPTPKSWLFTGSAAVEGIFEYPLIVKPVAEDASMGVNFDAIVHDLDSLKRRVDYVQKVYRQNALVEKFIAGREINVAIWDNPLEALPISEIDFSAYNNPNQHIVSYSAKWEQDSFDYHHTPGICPAKLDHDTESALIAITLECWHCLKCKDYARVDFRVDESGKIFVIEMNCNPDLSPEAGFYRSAQAAGFSFEGMIHRILESAVKNYIKF